MRASRLIALFIVLGVSSTIMLAGMSAQSEERARNVLYFTKSSGFEHSVVKREGGRLGHSERIVAELLAANDYKVVCSKDGGEFTSENLKKYGTVMMYTSGNLLEAGTDKEPPMSAGGLQALFDWVKNGGGLLGVHAATDTLRNDREATEFTKMIGGAFLTHKNQEEATLKVVDPDFPAVARLPVEFRFHEEWYLHQQINLAKTMHVLILLDTKSMTQEAYTQLPPQPITWCSMYGKGRVFFTAIGHREDVWEMPLFQGLLLDALKWTNGEVEGDASPNFEEYL